MTERIIELVVGVFCADAEHRLCLVRSKSRPNVLIVPGGHVRYGESILETAVREMREETGTRLLNAEVRSWIELLTYGDDHRHLIAFNVMGHAQEARASPEDTEEISEVCWIPLREAVADERVLPRMREEIKILYGIS